MHRLRIYRGDDTGKPMTPILGWAAGIGALAGFWRLLKSSKHMTPRSTAAAIIGGGLSGFIASSFAIKYLGMGEWMYGMAAGAGMGIFSVVDLFAFVFKKTGVVSISIHRPDKDAA